MEDEFNKEKVKEIAHGIIDEMIDRIFDEYSVDQEFVLVSLRGLEYSNLGEDEEHPDVIPALIEYTSEINISSQTTSLIKCVKFPDVLGVRVREKIEEAKKSEHNTLIEEVQEESRAICDDEIRESIVDLQDTTGFSTENIIRTLNYIRTGRDPNQHVDETEDEYDEYEENIARHNNDPVHRARELINSLYTHNRWIGITNRPVLVEHVSSLEPSLAIGDIQSLIEEHNIGTGENIDESTTIQNLIDSIICEVCGVDYIIQIMHVSDQERFHINQRVLSEIGANHYIVDRRIDHILDINEIERRTQEEETVEMTVEIANDQQETRGEIPQNVMNDEPDPNEDVAI